MVAITILQSHSSISNKIIMDYGGILASSVSVKNKKLKKTTVGVFIIVVSYVLCSQYLGATF